MAADLNGITDFLKQVIMRSLKFLFHTDVILSAVHRVLVCLERKTAGGKQVRKLSSTGK